jgi:O-antigen ligase
MLGLALSLFLYAEQSFLKKLSGVLLVVLPLPVIFCLSRSAYLAAIFIILILGITSRRRWIIFILAIFLVLSPVILPRPVIERALYNFRDPRYFGFLDQSAGERFFVFQKVWDFIKRYPFLGGGVAAAGGILDNQYARVIIDTGLIGLALFIWLIMRLLKLGARLFRHAEEGWVKGVALGFVTIVIGVVIHGLGNITFYIVRIAEPFWALAGLIAFLSYMILQPKAAANISLPER